MLFLLVFLISGSSGLFENCDFYQKLKPEQAYYITSPDYPDFYQPKTSCRWFAEAPAGSKVFLLCENANIPSSKSCIRDRLLVSPTGDPDMQDASKYCGSGRISVTSTSNKMNIALISSKMSRGGAFQCSLGVEASPSSEQTKPETCQCGWKNPVRIVGGQNTGVNEFPMMAALIDGQRRDLFCGATIISPNFALTAAHCLIGKKPRTIGLLVGDYDTGRGNDTDSARLLLIDKFQSHPQYSSTTQNNDIALVHTETPIEFSPRVGPACLPFVNSKDSFAGEQVVALGWGTTDFGGKQSSVLQKVDLKVITTAQCQRSYGTMVSSKQICTYEKDKDACQSDSGGPVLWEDPTTGRIKHLGIISYGIQCATENPGVNTRVSKYLSWIVENADDEYCVT